MSYHSVSRSCYEHDVRLSLSDVVGRVIDRSDVLPEVQRIYTRQRISL